MFTERRIAQLGLVGAIVILGGSVALLLGAKDDTHEALRVQAGMPAPAVNIEDVAGHRVNLNEKGHLTVLCFDSANTDENTGRLKKIITDANPKGTELATDEDISVTAGPAPEPTFVTLSDQRGEVASRFDVHTNPTYFVIDENGLIRYRGVFDNGADDLKLTENYLTSALHTFGDGKQVTVAWVQGRAR